MLGSKFPEIFGTTRDNVWHALHRREVSATQMNYANSDLVGAFPAFLRNDALKVVSVLPQPAWNSETFSVRVTEETLSIPYRIYHDPALIDATNLNVRQRELLHCLMTKHHDGFVRERHLANILCARHEWVPPFLFSL